MKILFFSVCFLALSFIGHSQTLEYKVEGFKRNCVINLDSLTFRWSGSCPHYLQKNDGAGDLHKAIYFVAFNKWDGYFVYLYAMPGNEFKNCELSDGRRVYKMTLVKLLEPAKVD